MPAGAGPARLNPRESDRTPREPPVVIAIVAHTPRERAAFTALCESHGWASAECDSLRALRHLLRTARPGIVLTRHRLGDGYSDDVMFSLSTAGLRAAAKVIVLIGAGTPSSVEARQVALGADLVQRDPVRTDVLVEYLAKYRGSVKRLRTKAPPTGGASFRFAGAIVQPAGRKIHHGAAAARLTPREIGLVEFLFRSPGSVVTYDTLYTEVLGRRFRGDTANMRVLLRLLDASYRSVGLVLRTFVEVIPKSGYRYHLPPTPGS